MRGGVQWASHGAREESGNGGDLALDGDDSADGAAARGSSLTPAVLKLLLVPKHDVAEVDEISAELHVSERGGPPAARSLLHALSKESLDIMRAERIARRMARADEQVARGGGGGAGVSIIGPVRAVGFEQGAPAAHHSTKPRKAKSSRREERVFMPIVVK